MTKRTNSQNLILWFIFFAGSSFLIYEVSWFRMIALVSGATVTASTIVLSAFMAGFGSGAWFWSNKALSRFTAKQLLLSLSIFLGIYGLGSRFIFNQGILFVYETLPSTSGFSLNALLSFTILLILLIIPAFFMGGILPLASSLFIRNSNDLASRLGRIYAWETLGSAIGGLATGTLLIRYLGQANTLLFAAALNLLPIGLLLLSRPKPDEVILPADKTPKAKPSLNPDQLTNQKKTALFASFVFGLSVLGLQLAWFRIFRVYLTNTSYTFSLIASIVILGLFAGSWFFSGKGGRFLKAIDLPRLLLIAAILSIAGFFIMLKLPQFIMFPLSGEQDSYMLRIIIIPLVSAILVILPVTFISGMAFPLACSLYSPDYKTIGQGIGRVVFYNTLGSILGPLLTAFILIPLLGAAQAILFYTVVLLVSAFLMLRLYSPTSKWPGYTAMITSAILIAILLISPKTQILPPSFSRFNREIIEYKETTEGSWVVGREPGGKGAALATYVNNSAVIGSSYDAIKVVKMVGHLPFYCGLECRNVLVVGFGIGVTTSAIASHPEVEKIDCIELVAGLKNAAHHYEGLNHGIQNDRRLRVRAGDGRQYLQSTSEKYDLISSDPTHPILGSGSLYTREYFELCRKRLNPGGMVSQYLPLHKLLPGDFQSIIKTFASVFPHASIWLGQNHAVLLGATKPLKINFTQWESIIQQSGQDPYFYNNPYHLASCLMLDNTAISKFPADIPILTDDKPLTEFFKLSSFDSRNMGLNLLFLHQNRIEPGRVFHAIPDTEQMQRFVLGNQLTTEGILLNMAGDKRGFIRKLQEAAQNNPENEEIPFLIRFYGQ